MIPYLTLVMDKGIFDWNIFDSVKPLPRPFPPVVSKKIVFAGSS
jgi:hypothetical protein